MIPVIRRSFIRLIYICFDVVFIYLAIFLACLIRAETLPFDVSVVSVFFEQTNPFRFLFVFWMTTIILFLNAKALYYTRREIIEGFELWELFKAVILATLVVVVTIYAVKLEGFPRTILFIGTGFVIVFLSLWRVLKRWFVEYLVINGYNNFNAVIIGAGVVGTALAVEIKKRPGLGINILGFLDDQEDKLVDAHGLKVLGRISAFTRITRQEFVDKIFVAAQLDGAKFLTIMQKAKELGVSVRVVPQGFEFMSREFIKYNIGVIPILEYSDVKTFSQQAGKRLFDFFVSLLALICLAPLLMAIAFIVRITSAGPAFYKSERYGRGGRKFSMYKFRSMVKNADDILEDYLDDNELDGPIFKMKKDPRVTNFGRFLRKYSLDELPQILNVFKGDMSLVGPRPLPLHQVQKADFNQLRRLEVRPGITGLWQIKGRSDISFKRLVRWDIWYINNWSFWLDLNILWQTIPVVIRGKGAY
ncbi:sugar transferase [Candidatus Omnitrophota bacterium]